jgi:hypothetical protein
LLFQQMIDAQTRGDVRQLGTHIHV